MNCITAFAGVLLCLLLSVGIADARPRSSSLHPDCNVLWPCVGSTVSKSSKAERRETVRQARGRYLEERLPFGRAIETRERVSQILGRRPDGCPRRFCGCGVSLKVFGQIIPALNLPANWKRFAPTSPGAKTVAWRPGHVVYVEAHVSGNSYRVYDPNSGGGKIRRHVRNLAGFRFVDPSRG